MRKRLPKILLWLLAVVLVWCGILGTSIWRYGARDGAAKSACIVVLGAAVQGTIPSPVYEERIRHGVHLYQTGYAPKIVFTGGFGDGQSHSEAAVGRSLAIQLGVPPADILMEENSRTTMQNLVEARTLIQHHGLDSVILVSDPLHMKRAMMMADDLGMVAASSPTPTSRFRSFRTKFGFLLREIYFLLHYVITGN